MAVGDIDVELEELAVEDETGEEAEVELGRSRWRVALAALATLAVVAALAVVSSSGGDRPGPPLVTGTTVPVRIGFTVLAMDDGTAILGIRDEAAFEVPVDPELGTVTGLVVRQRAIVATLSGGTARWWSQRAPEGVDLGPAAAVHPAAEPGEVWLVEPTGSRWQVRRAVVGEGSRPAEDPVTVPRRAGVVGAVSGVLVTGRDGSPSTVRLWDPDTGAERELADDAVVVAAGADRVALAVGDELRILGGPGWGAVAVFEQRADDVSSASFSRDGRYLALVRDDVRTVTVLDVDGGDGTPLATADLADAAGRPTAWTDRRLLVAAPDSSVLVVNPEDGATRRVGPIRDPRP